MLEFPCPTCGKRVQGDDTFAGKHVVCPHCHATVTLPKTPAESTAITDTAPPLAPYPGVLNDRLPPDDAQMPSVKKTAPKPPIDLLQLAANLLPAVVIIVIVITAIGLLLPAGPTKLGASNRTQSVNNLKQVGLAMQAFHDQHRRMPFNGIGAAAAGDPTTGSWAFQILPHIDQVELFNNPNLALEKKFGVHAYMCPERKRQAFCTTGPWADYCINPWLNDPERGRVDAPDQKVKLTGIRDGTSTTIFAGHGSIDPRLYSATNPIAQSADIFKGGNPAMARRSTTNQIDERNNAGLHWGGPFKQGSLIVVCDATVRMIPYSITGGLIVNGKSVEPKNRAVDLENPRRAFAPFLTPTGEEDVEFPD